MSECTNIDMKYLRSYEGGVEIRIERSGITYVKKVPFRKNGGLEKTWSVARILRDEKHLELFSTPISKRFYHVNKKKSKCTLPPGISLGYSRGILLYVVVSWCPSLGHVKRKRFNINKIVFDEALDKAIKFRKTVTSEIDL
jgi:hypothetical protein